MDDGCSLTFLGSEKINLQFDSACEMAKSHLWSFTDLKRLAVPQALQYHL
jgi:hypothetical protein